MLFFTYKILLIRNCISLLLKQSSSIAYSLSKHSQLASYEVVQDYCRYIHVFEFVLLYCIDFLCFPVP